LNVGSTWPVSATSLEIAKLEPSGQARAVERAVAHREALGRDGVQRAAHRRAGGHRLIDPVTGDGDRRLARALVRGRRHAARGGRAGRHAGAWIDRGGRRRRGGGGATVDRGAGLVVGLARRERQRAGRGDHDAHGQGRYVAGGGGHKPPAIAGAARRAAGAQRRGTLAT
jgi:hypothetical protein